MRSIPRPWRTLRGRLVLAAAAGLVVAAVVFAAVGGGPHPRPVPGGGARRARPPGRALAKHRQHQAERARRRAAPTFTFIEPSSLEALVGPEDQALLHRPALTPGAEQPTAEIPAVVATQLDYGVLERDGRAAHRLHAEPGQPVVSRPRPRRSRSAASRSGRSCWRGPPGELASAWPDVAGRVVGRRRHRPGRGPAAVPAPDGPHHPAPHGDAGGHPPGRARRPAHRAGAHRAPRSSTSWPPTST